MKELEAIGKTEYEFVLVDDCSPDGGETMAALMGLVRDYTCVRVVELAKNAGQHNAVIAGLNAAKGDAFIAMDDDMQTHPSQLKFLLEKFEEGRMILYGYYPHKKHSKFRNFGSYINYLACVDSSEKPKDLKTSSFWVIKNLFGIMRLNIRVPIHICRDSFFGRRGISVRFRSNILTGRSVLPIIH